MATYIAERELRLKERVKNKEELINGNEKTARLLHDKLESEMGKYRSKEVK